MNGFHDMNGWAWAMMAFGTVFWLSLVGLVFWVVVGAPHRRGAQDGDTPPSAREILDRRLTRGEIGVDEHERAVRRDSPAPHSRCTTCIGKPSPNTG